ncbi:WD40-repeat-containing domain protein [Kalaharituber pfeilii]|nr:WD40-repeat-containing domain protein [Kalaharituber pfeilii]
MKAIPLTIHWHDHNQPIYSAHFEPHGKGRLATAGGDNNVRLWKVHGGENPRVTYLSTLAKHNQAVNVVRFCPRGEMLASAGDDGTVILWIPSENGTKGPAFGEDDLGDKETWRLKHMCRSMGSEIYDLAWSPDGVFFITGSMDNIARVWNAQTGQIVRQIAEHNHYVQGVAWDPLNEFIATQSSDRSVHIYTLKTKDGQFTLAQHGKISKMDLPPRRVSSGSPAPPDLPLRTGFVGDSSAVMASPAPSTPGTPTSFSMNPPVLAASRRSSFGSSPSLRRSTSPSPALPLPAVKPMEFSPKVHGLGVKNTNIYFNETLTSFFRRLTFTPDGSLLLTPAGQYKTTHPPAAEGGKPVDEIINTVYIYTRAGLNKPPIAHLPGHKKPSVAVKCSPILYTPHTAAVATKHITVDTSSADDAISSLPPPALSTEMEPPSISRIHLQATSQTTNPATPEPSIPEIPPNAAFALPYRMVYAVATQDAVLIYDTHQQTPICVVSNLHYAAFTDLTWSSDGLTLLMTSTDGFCSVVIFEPDELGQVYTGPTPPPVTPILSASNQPTVSSLPQPALTRTPSASSVNTISSLNQGAMNLTPTIAPVPSITASSSSSIPLTTPPQTPLSGSVLGKREGETVNTPAQGPSVATEEGGDKKRRRIAPTVVSPGIRVSSPTEKND